MNLQKLRYKFHSGKNSKPWYYVKEYVNLHLPTSYLMWRRKHLLEAAKKRDDYGYILQRWIIIISWMQRAYISTRRFGTRRLFASRTKR